MSFLPERRWRHPEHEGVKRMSHELSIQDGKVEHAYVGQVGWHGLGNRLEAGASIEEWQKAAGMDWRIQRSKVRFNTSRDDVAANYIAMDDRHVLFRSDTKAALSVVSDGFKVVQPAAVLEFFRDLTGRAGFTLDTAGVLFGGRRFWALAKVSEDAQVGVGDSVGGYLLLSTSCDGTMATEGRFTSVRVVCHNTLTMARGDKANVKVTHRSVFRPEDMKKEMGIEGRERFAEFMSDMRRLADTKLLESEAVQMTVELFKPGAAKLAREEFVKAVESRPVVSVLEMFLDGKAKGSKLDGVQGTAWGWLNAVTEHVDHASRARSDDNRRASAWFGPGEAIKARALEMASAA